MFYAEKDEFIHYDSTTAPNGAPVHSSMLDGARNYKVPGHLHTSLLTDGTTVRRYAVRTDLWTMGPTESVAVTPCRSAIINSALKLMREDVGVHPIANPTLTCANPAAQ